MGQIMIEGLGRVEIEGDTPNEAEQQAILNAIGDPEDPDDEPTIGSGAVIDSPRPTPRAPQAQEGLFGIVPRSARQGVRETIEGAPGLIELAAEIGPSVLGAVKGGTAGAAAGTAVFPGVGTAIGGVLGAAAGGLAGEALAQETGIAPRSNLNLALSGAGPVAGSAVGGALRVGRRGVGAALTRAPFARTARARNVLGQAVQEFESIGTRILGRQKGLISRSADDLFGAMRRAGAVVSPDKLAASKKAIVDLQQEIAPLTAFPEVRQANRLLTQINNTLLNDPAGVSVDTLVRARQLVGSAVQRAQSAGGVRLGQTKKVFAALSDDLDRIATDPSLSGRAARLAKAATQRAKLEFAVKDLEQGVARFIKDAPNLPGGTTINLQGFSKWLRNVTNPKSAQFDKNLASALKDELPAMRQRLDELIKITADAGSPGGPGSLVLRGQFAATGRTAVGALLGGAAGGTVGAGVGAVLGASAPEMIVGALSNKTGAAFLERAARLGKGQISRRAWNALGQIVARSAGEDDERRLPGGQEGTEATEVPGEGTVVTP